MSFYRNPTRVFTNLSSTLKREPQTEAQMDLNLAKPNEIPIIPIKKSTTPHELRVSARGAVSLAPDRCVVVISIGSCKEHVQEAKNSVARRQDYILQTLSNHSVKEADMRVSKTLQRVDGQYSFKADVTVEFSDFNKCQALCNLLVEKLDDSVKISEPEYFHSTNKMDSIRKQAGVLAVQNAKSKAADMAGMLGAKVGQVLNIYEEQSTEWEGSPSSTTELGGYHRKIAESTLNVAVQISATFEMITKRFKQKNTE